MTSAKADETQPPNLREALARIEELSRRVADLEAGRKGGWVCQAFCGNVSVVIDNDNHRVVSSERTAAEAYLALNDRCYAMMGRQAILYTRIEYVNGQRRQVAGGLSEVCQIDPYMPAPAVRSSGSSVSDSGAATGQHPGSSGPSVSVGAPH